MSSLSYSPFWREKFQVHSFDIGLNARMRMSSVCSYLAEVAGKHANHLDIGHQFMQQQGMVWVLSRLFVKIDKMPRWGQDFYVETWPMGCERIFFRRDYKIDDGNNILIRATSYWLLIDLKTRKPKTYALNEDVLKANAGKFSMDMPTEGFPAVVTDTCEIHPVKYSDLDQNNHVNNARYVEWIFDVLDAEVLEKASPVFFSIEYKHEAKAGDAVHLRKVRLESERPTFAVEGSLSGSDKICVRSKVIF
jgi:medium-chain acyl-[acyl-carrier-protein] hydrolase